MYKTQGYLSTTTYNYTELWVSLAASLQIKEEDREVLYDPTDYMYLLITWIYSYRDVTTWWCHKPINLLYTTS